MKFLKQIAIIFAICLAGEAVALLLPFPFPGSVVSMILLFVLLMTGVLKLEQVDEAGSFLLNNMAFLFVPTVVGMAEYFPLIAQNLLALAIIIVVTTLLTFAVTAWTVTGVIRLQAGRTARRKEEQK